MANNTVAGGAALLVQQSPFGKHTSIVQAALDEARRRGISLSPPVRSGRDGDVAASSLSPAVGEGFSGRSRSAGAVDSSGRRFEDLIREAAAKEGVDPALLSAVAHAESNYDPNAVSSAGAKGVMQLMDSTARTLGVKDSFDPAQSILGGAKYLKQLLAHYGGDTTRAVAAYNAGPGAVDRSSGVPPYQETQSYVQRVLRFRDQARGA